MHVDDQRVENVRDGIPPTTRKELRSFLGLASYYRIFIPCFAKIAKPLNEKTSDKIEFVWSEEMQTARSGELREELRYPSENKTSEPKRVCG